MDKLSLIPQTDHSADSITDEFYAAALRRILRNMAVIGAALVLAAFIKLGFRVATGFAIGCCIAALNFYWIKRIVAILADKITQQQTAKPRGTKLRFALRYILVGLIVYVIFKSSVASFNALLTGLFLPVPAILAEGAYELLVLLRR